MVREMGMNTTVMPIYGKVVDALKTEHPITSLSHGSKQKRLVFDRWMSCPADHVESLVRASK